MDRFKLYAQYYNLLYKDKEYAREALYVISLIQKYQAKTTRILNFGCGTGKHDYALAQQGYKVTGVDLSDQMIAQAKANTPADLPNNLRFITHDIRTVELNESFDTVISLFHVLSYQVKNADLINTLHAAWKHLPAGGLFIFDCWYGPGVLTDPPTTRIKRTADDNINVVRLAEPVLDSLNNTVAVNYTILINKPGLTEVTEIKETHNMRYLFKQEIELLIKDKFELLAVNEWLQDTEPTEKTWNAVFTLKKI